MTHLTVAPIIVPALAAALLLMLHSAPLRITRIVSAAATALFVAASIALFAGASSDALLVYALGGWPAPFGIVLVADRLSALMVLLTALLAAAVLTYAMQGWDVRGRFFHALFQFQVMGLAGAFLTGDLFNLFVFFEVLLIASYCLMLQGLGAERLRATLHYVAMNLTASGVFLIAVSLLYGVTGTLNMAHLAERVAALPAQDVALARAAGLLLIGVFCVKAALFPLYFWLPAAYSQAAAPVATLFSIMTKVGVYAIIRVTTLVFGADAGAARDLLSPWLLPLALATLALGALGALGAQRLATMTAYLTIASVGTMLAAISAGGSAGLSAALYYLAHSTLAIAVLFVVCDLLGRSRGEWSDALREGPPLRHAASLGLAFVFAGATVAGLPPSTGFLGKLLVLGSVRDAAGAAVIWAVVLGSSFLILMGCARAGSLVLWKIAVPQPSASVSTSTSGPAPGEWCALVALMACSVLLIVFAAPAKSYADAAAAQLASPKRYVQAVLGQARGDLVRPLPAKGPR